MSIAAIRSGVDLALDILSDAGISYRTGESGAWTAFPGGVLNTDPPIGVAYVDDEGGESQDETGTLVARLGSVRLAIHNQVRDHQSKVWVITAIDVSATAVLYRIKRTNLSDLAYDGERGGRG